MFERFARSWELVKASYTVLRSDKELIVFPIVSFFGAILVTIVFAVPMAATGFFNSISDQRGFEILEIVVAFLFYLVMYTVIIFSNTALVGAAMIRLKGGDPTLADGFRIARERLPIIIQYAAISATVGMILRFLRERGGLVGAIVAWIGNVAWEIATFLVVPVLVIENVGPVDAIKRSAALLKKTWGEQLAASFGIGAVFGLAAMGIVLLGVVLIMLFAGLESGLLVALVVIVMVVALIGLALFASALGGIYQAALYRYATEGEVSGAFTPDMVQGAFKPKRG